jgi:hypothetical protein
MIPSQSDLRTVFNALKNQSLDKNYQKLGITKSIFNLSLDHVMHDIVLGDISLKKLKKFLIFFADVLLAAFLQVMQ